MDRYDLQCKPVRDLLVDYITERQPALDYTTIKGLSATLAGKFWADLERHHPGIDSLRLSPEISTGWKTRLATKTVRKRQPAGAGQGSPARLRQGTVQEAQHRGTGDQQAQEPPSCIHQA